MLSNKLTFSLASLVMFVVVLALVSTTAVAQRVIELPDNSSRTDTDGYTVGVAETTASVDTNGVDSDFLVITRAVEPTDANSTSGILVADSHPARPIEVGADPAGNIKAAAATLPDLEDFFDKGGTIDVIVPISGRYEQADARWHEVVVTEVMWGLDWRPAGTTTVRIEPHTDKQWIELYNNTGLYAEGEAYHNVDGRGADHGIRTIDEVRLLFFNNIFLGSKAAESPPKDKAAGYVGVTLADGVTSYTWLTGRPVWTENGNNDDTADDPGFVSGTDTIYTAVYKVLDRVSNLGRGGRTGAMPGQSGSTAQQLALSDIDFAGTVVDGTYVPLISAFRKRVLLLDDQTGIGAYHPAHAFGAGTDIGQWMSSWEEENLVRRRNIENPYIGTPGAEHLTPKPPDKTVVGVGIVFNEIRNDTSEDDLDWIELYNNGTTAVDIGAYEITIVEGDEAVKTDTDLIGLPDKDDDGQDIMLGAGEYLVIVNRDPEDSILADGKDITINASNRLKLEGAEHLYYFPTLSWQLPSSQFNLVLRSAKDKNATWEAIQDIVGDLQIEDLRDDWDTKVWPLRYWGAIATGDAADKMAPFDTFGSRGRLSFTWARKPDTAGYEAYTVDHWWRNDNWVKPGYMGGVGYRKDLDHGLQLEAPGTPGYPNGVPSNLATYLTEDAAGAVTISEIMYDAGQAWDLVQWIELYNNSMTDSVDISDWTLDIRNAKDDEEPQRSFVDDEFEFEDGTIIAPNQTLLVVSATGATNVPANRVYDLYDRHGNDLGLKNRRAYLLSKVGFRLELYDDATSPVLVDSAGNAYLSGASVIVGEANPDDANDGGWVLHEVSGEGEARHSMVRQYGARFGTKNETLGYETAAPGTMTGAWREAGLESGNIGIFYGHTDDFSTPAFRRGGPLPVSLASFRPYRDKATGEVVVRWVTESELNNAGFNILRSDTKSGEFKVINLTGMIAGHGTTSEKHVYTYIDKTAKPNVVYYYQIEDVSMDGKRSTLTTTHLRGNVNAAGKLTTTWSDLKLQK